MDIASLYRMNRRNEFNKRVDQRTRPFFPPNFSPEHVSPASDTSRVEYERINKEEENKAEQSDLFSCA